MEMNKIEYLIIHNEGDDNGFNAVNEWHRQQGFTKSSLGFYVGYQDYMEKNGTIKKARLDTDEGCHTVRFNKNSKAICLRGNLDLSQPTTTKRHELRLWIQENMKKYNVPADKVKAHRYFKNTTTCCGKNLPDSELREMANYTQPEVPIEATESVKIGLMERLIVLLREMIDQLQNRLKMGGNKDSRCEGG